MGPARAARPAAREVPSATVTDLESIEAQGAPKGHGSEPIEPIAAREVPHWDDEADVVVVGLGCAGASAAVEAAEAGARVLALEAAPAGGGTSSMSGGLIYLGGGTPLQEALGYHDTPDNMARFLTAACGPGTDPDKVDAYCEGSVAHFHWLVEHGVPFEERFFPEHDREPPDDSGLIFSGGEDSWPFDEIAEPAPRGHHPKFPDAAGGFLMRRLLAAVDLAGVEVRADSPVARLVVDGDRGGEVVGVEARTGDGETRFVRAGRGVVIAAGGFIFNATMVAEHCPVATRCTVPIGTMFDDGRGIRMAQGAGATAVRMDRIEVGIAVTPPRHLVKGILVNGRGQRFMNEDTYAGRLGQEFLMRQDGEVYFVHDDDSYAPNVIGYQASWVAASADELGEAMGLPTGALAATIERYNAAATTGDDPDHHKRPPWVRPLEPPYGAVDYRVEVAHYAPFTLGGLATTPDSEVLGGDGTAVPGLYAAGRTTAGIAAHGYVSGVSLGDGTFFGRAAGRHAAHRR